MSSVRQRASVTAFAIAAAIAAAMAIRVDVPAVEPSLQSDARTIVVIGDLHMGAGKAGAQWHPFEDFRWRDEFLAFLRAIDVEGGGSTDLIINGDLFDLLPSLGAACVHADHRLGCTEEEALKRLELVISAHADELQAIGAFARSGANRVHIVPGDHDAALFFRSVGRRVFGALAAPDDRVELAASGGWLSPDGRVYVEHGHQLAMSADRFASWPKPVVSFRGRDHLERPWGEQVLQGLYDRSEPRYPIVDNVAEEGVGAKYVLAAEGVDPPEGVPALLRYFLTKTTWQQFRMDLDEGEVRAPAWDIDQIRRDATSFLTSSLPADDPLSPLVTKTAAAGHLRGLDAQLSDDEIIAVCDYRAAIRRARRRMERVLTQLPGVGPPITECPRLAETIGPAFEYYWRSRDLRWSRHIQATLDRLRREKRTTHPFEVFVYGHSHLADRPFRPARDAGPVVASSGAWQRTIHPVQLEQMGKEWAGGVPALLAELQPEALQPCYSFLRVGPSSGSRAPQTRVWRRDKQNAWAMAGNCSG